jgi:hypothetical protein
LEIPDILVMPFSDWIAPFEDTAITGLYQNFVTNYNTGTSADWYLPVNVKFACKGVRLGKLGWGPYPLKNFFV